MLQPWREVFEFEPRSPYTESQYRLGAIELAGDTSTALVHLERRFDPFFRPAFDALLRDPIASLVTGSDQPEAPERRLENLPRKS